MRNKIQAPGKQVLHKQVPKAQAIQKEKDPRLVAVGGFGQVSLINLYNIRLQEFVNTAPNPYCISEKKPFRPIPLARI